MAGLYEASLRGDVHVLAKLLTETPRPRLDERFTGHSRTPLHMAVMGGHVRFAGELLRGNEHLAMEQDSHGFTPLHLASARPSISMVKQLLDSNDEACMVRDNEGRTPLHLAATKDRVSIMKVLMAQKPEAIHIQNSQYETILHLCVKHDSLNALKLLVEQLPSMAAPVLNTNALSINSTDSDGNTILHLAAQMKRMKFIEYLVESKNIGIDIDILNTNGDKALDMFPEMKYNLEIGCYVSSKEEEEGIVCSDTTKKANASRDQKWMIEKVNALMVVATLVAGIAFQAAMNPPGGVFQEDSKIKASENPVIFTYYLRSVAKSTKSSRFGQYLDRQQPTQSQILLQELLNTLDNDTYTPYSPYVMGKSPGIVMEHDKWNKIISKYKPRFSPYLIRYAGTPILAYKNPRIYNLYMTYNAIAFLVSLSIIVLVISGFIDTKETTNHQVRVLIGMMIVSITAWLLSFISVFISMSPPFYINHPLLSQAFIISIATLVVCMYGYHLWMLIKVKHWIKILWWKIMRKDRLIDQFHREYCALDSYHHISLLSKAVFLRFMPVFYFILLATLSLPFLYGYTNRA